MRNIFVILVILENVLYIYFVFTITVPMEIKLAYLFDYLLIFSYNV